MNRDVCKVISRWLVMQGMLGKARTSMLKWLLEAGDRRSDTAAAVRAKAVKALGAVIEVDVQVMHSYRGVVG